jgi:hypothetical protein
MKAVTASLVIFAAIAACVSAPAQEKEVAPPYRVLNIPAREHGYGNFKTQVIHSQKELDDLIKKSVGDLGWNNRQAFVEGLQKGKVNFEREALVLLRNTEGSGSVKVTPQPQINGKTLIVRLRRDVPEIGTADIADYCFAIAVDRGRIEQVQYVVDGRPEEKLNVKKAP